MTMWTWKTARRVVVAVIGGTVVLLGLLLGPLPFVPAIIIVPLGLAILATEFVWAQRLLKKVKDKTKAAAGSMGWGCGKKDAPLEEQKPCPPETQTNPEGGRDARPPEADK